VLRGIARGHTNAEIAAALYVSVRTIELTGPTSSTTSAPAPAPDWWSVHGARICLLMTSFSNARAPGSARAAISGGRENWRAGFRG